MVQQIHSNLILIGPPGVGKTTIGKLLAKKLNHIFYDVDEYIVNKQEMPMHDIFRIHGESKFRVLEQQAIYTLTKIKNIILATGGGSVLDANNRSMLSSIGEKIYLTASIKNLCSRIMAEVDKRPLLNHSTQSELEKKLLLLLKEREKLYNSLASFSVATDSLTPKDVVTKVLYRLNLYSTNRVKENAN